ncbi:hypothetical protein CsSME_00050925 [Camellia sinensis var. sinensis]
MREREREREREAELGIDNELSLPEHPIFEEKSRIGEKRGPNRQLVDEVENMEKGFLMGKRARINAGIVVEISTVVADNQPRQQS